MLLGVCHTQPGSTQKWDESGGSDSDMIMRGVTRIARINSQESGSDIRIVSTEEFQKLRQAWVRRVRRTKIQTLSKCTSFLRTSTESGITFLDTICGNASMALLANLPKLLVMVKWLLNKSVHYHCCSFLLCFSFVPISFVGYVVSVVTSIIFLLLFNLPLTLFFLFVLHLCKPLFTFPLTERRKKGVW